MTFRSQRLWQRLLSQTRLSAGSCDCDLDLDLDLDCRLFHRLFGRWAMDKVTAGTKRQRGSLKTCITDDAFHTSSERLRNDTEGLCSRTAPGSAPARALGTWRPPHCRSLLDQELGAVQPQDLQGGNRISKNTVPTGRLVRAQDS